MNRKECPYRWEKRLPDTLSQQTESSTTGVLIVSDYYHEVISSERVEVQEGLYFIKSKFGWIISGKTKTNGRIHHENTMFLMTHSSTQVLPNCNTLATQMIRC